MNVYGTCQSRLVKGAVRGGLEKVTSEDEG